MEANLVRVFNGTDYSGWAREMTWYLKDKELWSVVGKSHTDIEGNKEELKRKDSTAMAKIGLHLDRDIQRHIMECETACEAWERLASHFKSKSKRRSAKMLFQLISSKHAEDEPVTNFVLKQRELYGELKELGIDISEDILKISILKGLSKGFDSIRDTILNEKSDDLLDYDELKTRLHEFELEKDTKVSHSEDGKVFSATNEIICDNCGKPGHKWRKCRKKLKDHLQKRKDNYTARKQRAQVNEVTIFSAVGDEVNNTTEQEGETLTWILDTGATNHITGEKTCFVCYQEYSSGVVLPDGSRVNSAGKGDIELNVVTSDGTRRVKLCDVLHIPSVKKNILSLTSIIGKGARLEMDRNSTDLTIKDQHGNPLVKSKLENRLYVLKSVRKENSSLSHIKVENSRVELFRWHCRLGHQSEKYLLAASKSGSVDGMPCFASNVSLPACDSCLSTKSTRAPFNGSRPETTRCLQRVHSDFAGPIEPPTMDGYIGYVSFIDDFSHFHKVYLVKSKYEIFDRFQEYKAWAEKLTGEHLKILRTDNGGEFHSHRFSQWLKKHGIEMENTAPYSPQQNGVAERFNRTVFEMARAMMKHSGLPKIFWGEAVTTAVDILNLKVSPTSETRMTPFQIWNKRTPNLRKLRVFGSDCFVHVPKEKRKKLDDTAERCKLIGYSVSGYRVVNQKGRIFTSRDIMFNEEPVIFSSMQMAKWSTNETTRVNESKTRTVKETSTTGDIIKDKEVASPSIDPNSLSPASTGEQAGSEYSQSTASETTPPATPLRRSERIQSRVSDTVRRISQGEDEQESNLAMCLHISSVEEPRSYEDAVRCDERDLWRTAMDKEYDAIIKNNTWELVDLPTGRKAVSTKWVYKFKEANSNGPPRYKARLVVRGFLQKQGIDYDQVFAPTLRFTTLRVLLALATHMNMYIHNLDIKTAFLNSHLKEEVYIEQPKGYVDPNHPNKVCLLKKTLYGLKQAPREWNYCLNETMLSMGFKQSPSDHCLYYQSKGNMVLVVVYVDDIIVASTDLESIALFKSKISNSFETKDLGPLTTILGIDVDYNKKKGTLVISQASYIDKILKEFEFDHSIPVGSPSQPGLRLTKHGKLVDNVRYRQAVGSLMYCMLLTRPDLAFPVSEVSRFVESPTTDHWNALKRIFKYLRGTTNYGLKFYRGSSVQLEGYCDADFASDRDKRRSQTGYIFKIGGNTISWRSIMQKTVALSTVEAEYLALSDALKEGLWLRQLLQGLGIKLDPITMYEDNTGTIAIAKDPQHHGRTKHIDVRHHFIREHVARGTVQIQHCASVNMTADALTKGLHPNHFTVHRNSMNVVNRAEC